MNSTILICLLVLPLFLQGFSMFFDEFYFHRKRGLPKWERIGHPMDTFSVILTMAIPVFLNFSTNTALLYGGMSLFSSILVTKDEFVHSKFCEPKENWLHGLLFVLHPMVFLSLGLIWYQRDLQGLSTSFLQLPATSDLKGFLSMQLIVTIVFMFYQIIYWNFIRKDPA